MAVLRSRENTDNMQHRWKRVSAVLTAERQQLLLLLLLRLLLLLGSVSPEDTTSLLSWSADESHI